MKETVNANIGSVAFTIDRDAYRVLKSYLEDIRKRLPVGDAETMDDIERGLAEIFSEKVTSNMQVITLDMARGAMARMGTPADFGEQHASEQAPLEAQAPRKLYRSCSDRSIAGICGGLAEYFDIDVTLLRVITLLAIFFGGLSIWVYIILWIVIPEQCDAPQYTTTTKKNK